MTAMKQGDTVIDTTGYYGVIDSGTSVLVGGAKLVDPLIEGIIVAQDCSNLDKLPTITFQFDDQDYPLTAEDYVLKITEGDETECMLGVQSMTFPEGFNYFIVGDVFLRKYPAYFDLNDNSVSFQVAKSLA